jgi:hypothetical protein
MGVTSACQPLRSAHVPHMARHRRGIDRSTAVRFRWGVSTTKTAQVRIRCCFCCVFCSGDGCWYWCLGCKKEVMKQCGAMSEPLSLDAAIFRGGTMRLSLLTWNMRSKRVCALQFTVTLYSRNHWIWTGNRLDGSRAATCGVAALRSSWREN